MLHSIGYCVGMFNPQSSFGTNLGKIILFCFLKIVSLIWAVQDLATFPKFATWTHNKIEDLIQQS